MENEKNAAVTQNVSCPYTVNIFPADTTGCNWYRNLAPQLTMEQCIGGVTFNTCRKFVIDKDFFRFVNVNIIQRQVTSYQRDYFLKFIMPMSQKFGSWIVYNVDDCIHKDDVPVYNKSHDTYNTPGYSENIKEMLNATDFILVTTDELGNYYKDRFGITDEQIIVIPNYIPFWWMGASFNKERIMASFKANVTEKHRPRIGIIGAPAHYDTGNKKVENDITHLLPYIRKTIKDYQWVVFGSMIPELENEISRGEIEAYHGIDILQYPRMLCNLNLQYVVAPLLDNVFNRCKSNIKLTESWASGFGCAAQDLCCYNKYTNDVFSDDDSLHSILSRDLKNADAFEAKIVSNHKQMANWWLESHMTDWIRLYKLRQKPLIFDFDSSIKSAVAAQTASSDDIITPPSIKIKQ